MVAPGFCTPRIDMHMWLPSASSTQMAVPARHSRSLHDDRNTARSNCLLDRKRHLLRQALLHLQPPRERLGDTRKLRQTKNKLVRDVPNRDLP